MGQANKAERQNKSGTAQGTRRYSKKPIKEDGLIAPLNSPTASNAARMFAKSATPDFNKVNQLLGNLLPDSGDDADDERSPKHQETRTAR